MSSMSFTPDLGLNPSVSVADFYTELQMQVNETVIKGILESFGKDSVYLEQLKKAESTENTQKSQQYSSAVRGLQSETYNFFTATDVTAESPFKPNSTQSQGRKESMPRDELRARLQESQDVSLDQRNEVSSVQRNNEL
ncbi:hypothetical protein [Shewanella surugensis]|uniref:Uncharacterized protein n=1 Tax=Shewanella surugensis TaxID=212020 RepID=A0ABT0L781_9GAMM|nr:hypothetical protein [Shewanella surugensis]MCL1123547.1 hypothetical protein [Shewanella surugensis]